jgi:hypothetical protein
MYKNKHKSRTNMGKQSTVIVKDVSDNNSSSKSQSLELKCC